MAYRVGERLQISLLPKMIEDYVDKEDPVRAYDAFVEALNFEELGIEIDNNKVGNSSYDPKAMLKLLVYGYSYGIRSSRKLERALHHNLSFIWLVGGLKPDHKTISKFRKDNQKGLKMVIKLCARMCIKLDLIEGNILFLDGSKMRGNASINQTKTQENLEKRLVHIDLRIDELLKECDKIDQREEASLVKMRKELSDKERLKSKILNALDQVKEEGLEKINLTDSECSNMRGRQGGHAGYNAQVVVDEENGLIVNSEIVSKNNDLNQFSSQIDKANEVLKKNCKTACANAGYSSIRDLSKKVKTNIEIIVPDSKEAQHEPTEENPFSKENFIYDPIKVCYYCPEGKILTKHGYEKDREEYSFKIKNPSVCKNCKNYGICTSSKTGRKIKRSEHEEIRKKIKENYKTDRAQEIYSKRKEKSEHPFGHIKRNLNGGYF